MCGLARAGNEPDRRGVEQFCPTLGAGLATSPRGSGLTWVRLPCPLWFSTSPQKLLWAERVRLYLLPAGVGPLAHIPKDALRPPWGSLPQGHACIRAGEHSKPHPRPMPQAKPLPPSCPTAHHYTTPSPKSQEKNLRRHAYLCKAHVDKELEFQNSSRTGLKTCPYKWVPRERSKLM